MYATRSAPYIRTACHLRSVVSTILIAFEQRRHCIISPAPTSADLDKAALQAHKAIHHDKHVEPNSERVSHRRTLHLKSLYSTAPLPPYSHRLADPATGIPRRILLRATSRHSGAPGPCIQPVFPYHRHGSGQTPPLALGLCRPVNSQKPLAQIVRARPLQAVLADQWVFP